MLSCFILANKKTHMYFTQCVCFCSAFVYLYVCQTELIYSHWFLHLYLQWSCSLMCSAISQLHSTLLSFMPTQALHNDSVWLRWSGKIKFRTELRAVELSYTPPVSSAACIQSFVLMHSPLCQSVRYYAEF